MHVKLCVLKLALYALPSPFYISFAGLLFFVGWDA